MLDRLSLWLDRNSLYIALLAAWIAMCGSLYFSEVAGYVPCNLCWYQRILMYPLAVIIAVGLIQRVQALPLLVLPFSLLGIGVSSYHYLLEKTDLFSNSTTCDVGAPCTVAWINWLGFITIPFLALIAFLIITFMTVIAWQAGTPDPEDGETRPLLPVALITLLVVITFVVLGRVNAPVAHAESNSSANSTTLSSFTVIETGAAMGVDLPPATATAQMVAALAEGERLYAKSCVGCHGAQGQGIAGLGSSLQQSELVQRGSIEAVIKIISEGLAADNPINKSGVPMPPNGGQPALTDEELTAIVHYLRSVGQR